MPKDFSHQDLRGRSFKNQDLTDADFSHADIRGANFKGALLRGANFTHAKCGVTKKSLSVFIPIILTISIIAGSFRFFGNLRGSKNLIKSIFCFQLFFNK